MRILKSPGNTANASLKASKEYVVLEVGVGDLGAHFRVEAEDGTPIIVQAHNVDLTDGVIPPTWRCKLNPPNYLTFAPEAWLEPQFWNEFFDGSADAIRNYQVERDRIFKASGMKIEPKTCLCRGCGSGTHADRHGPCMSLHSDDPYRWRNLQPMSSLARWACPACLRWRVPKSSHH
jgi:hypothetical protein